ncbi:unnamed protein product [Mytilus edulis]|uniref:Uncharacterized protein n=1 Tax=Mytilus edulis TaxID=6550 RepID=A0A8S3UFD6_MYTED|nr:unnamed protein product [Mytilus edulis]
MRKATHISYCTIVNDMERATGLHYFANVTYRKRAIQILYREYPHIYFIIQTSPTGEESQRYDKVWAALSLDVSHIYSIVQTSLTEESKNTLLYQIDMIRDTHIPYYKNVYARRKAAKKTFCIESNDRRKSESYFIAWGSLPGVQYVRCLTV